MDLKARLGALKKEKNAVILAHYNQHSEIREVAYNKSADRTSRDIVSRSHDYAFKETGAECVFLDCTHLNIADFKTHFLNI